MDVPMRSSALPTLCRDRDDVARTMSQRDTEFITTR